MSQISDRAADDAATLRRLGIAVLLMCGVAIALITAAYTISAGL